MRGILNKASKGMTAAEYMQMLNTIVDTFAAE